LCFWPFRNENPYNGRGKADEHMVKKDNERTIPKDVLRAFIKENNLKTAENVQHALQIFRYFAVSTDGSEPGYE